MSMQVVGETGTRLPRHRQLSARAAVGAARVLVLLPPRRLRQVLTVAARGSRAAGHAQALDARRAVVTVSARCAGRGCLQRSVATVLLCRLRGRWPDWCTGFRTQPFRAHAWVEVGEQAVGESGDVALFHTVMSVRHRDGGRR
ncbi:lasso peptide biosynthesis B2 protein [Streptomyces sp. NPDC096057]|uniref:lasso peptide biosynthesis B2 protein n=1 Tax=Streptomyces sp. NPDC096057 TaxID=3155543 RepID=UPI00332A1283